MFRAGTIRQMSDKNKLYHELQLQLTADDDPQLHVLTDRIESEVQGQLDKAEELYALLLEQTSEKNDRAHYHHQLYYLKNNQGDYKMAIEYYEKAFWDQRKNSSFESSFAGNFVQQHRYGLLQHQGLSESAYLFRTCS
ncbi:unnamed protein product [Adineta ricciae]|uniref:Uncharacterized protein n=2 Tax=Adineta ricciae TaxID=249248 RepID=A0A814ZF42_ADIRI|nr:unnamed protein product [Adineta ricciae]